jgi:hypothetical protein
VRIDVSHTGIHFVLLKIQEIALRLEGRYCTGIALSRVARAHYCHGPHSSNKKAQTGMSGQSIRLIDLMEEVGFETRKRADTPRA